MTGAAVLTFGFDASVQLGEFVLRWQTLGIAVAVLAGLAWCALIAGTDPGLRRLDRRAPDDGSDGSGGIWHMRRDDLLFIVLGVLPGAVVLGRVGYGLLHADWYDPDWRQLLDPASGSVELTGAVVGGTLTGIYVAALLDAPVGRWLHVAIRPLLLVLALGKAAEVLGGEGQGLLVVDGGGFATAYAGAGPWGSPGAALPAIPSQLLEAGMAAVVLVLVTLLGWRTGPSPRGRPPVRRGVGGLGARPRPGGRDLARRGRAGAIEGRAADLPGRGGRCPPRDPGGHVPDRAARPPEGGGDGA